LSIRDGKEQIMKSLVAGLLVLGISIPQFSCTTLETFDVALVRKSIEEADAKFSEAVRDGNAARVVDVYTADATVVPPNGEIVKGKQGIEELYKKFFQMGVKEIVMTIIEVGGSGDTAYELGKSKVRVQPEGQAAMMDSTRYLVIWKRQVAGNWKVQVDFWSVSVPIPGK
jgi:uncharacterized protein (TIGR02246 family)